MTPSVGKSAEQKDAEAEVEGFRDDLGPFVVAAETTRMAMIFTDANAEGEPIIFANDSFLKLTRYTRDEVFGQPFRFLMAGSPLPDQEKLIAAQFSIGEHTSIELMRRRKTGPPFWAALFVSPVADEKGAVVQHFAALVDLTAHSRSISCRSERIE